MEFLHLIKKTHFNPFKWVNGVKSIHLIIDNFESCILNVFNRKFNVFSLSWNIMKELNMNLRKYVSLYQRWRF